MAHVAIDRAVLSPSQRDVLAAALRAYTKEQRARVLHTHNDKTKADAAWRLFVAQELLEMFV